MLQIESLQADGILLPEATQTHESDQIRIFCRYNRYQNPWLPAHHDFYSHLKTHPDTVVLFPVDFILGRPVKEIGTM